MEPAGLQFSLGHYRVVVEVALRQAQDEDVIQRICDRDPSLWKSDEARQKIIRNSLGWQNVARAF